jgi:hypothetical protein
MNPELDIEIKDKENFLLIETGNHSWLRVEKSLVKIIETATFQKVDCTDKKGFCFFENNSELPEFLKLLNKATGLRIAKKDFNCKFQEKNPLNEDSDQLLVNFSVNLKDQTTTFKLATAGFFGFKRKEATLFYNFDKREIYEVVKILPTSLIFDFSGDKISQKELKQATRQREFFTNMYKNISNINL